ncbi:hypothetical protein Vretimale_3951 [Volvox reticuliferus]|uniref:Uncharacterized protein n=1 Tax=Volvox reticuliferus TaxID=1737510 RepID=A0A8J4D9W7_9CHLO|nr:hypothetical protein Vretimale_3951 [Volvox reticuliferus]
MTKYQNIDWRNKSNWGCNARSSPQSDLTYDGITLDPLEVMFVKVKGFLLQRNITYSLKAAQYDLWLENETSRNVSLLLSNKYASNEFSYKAPRILVAKARGSSCFDAEFYRQRNRDLMDMVNSDTTAWQHYTFYGQFERRPHRYAN